MRAVLSSTIVLILVALSNAASNATMTGVLAILYFMFVNTA